MEIITQVSTWVEQHKFELLLLGLITLGVSISVIIIRDLVIYQLRYWEKSHFISGVQQKLLNINWTVSIVSGLYTATYFYNVIPQLQNVLYILVIVAWVWVAARIMLGGFELIIHQILGKFLDDDNEAAYKFLIRMGQILIAAALILLLLSNLGLDVNSLIAGLGIGGIAIAFGLQVVLGDFFSSLAIIADKPFRKGDTIRVGEIMGKVERIGLRSSTLRSLEGEIVIIPNAELAKSIVRNYSRLNKLRSLSTITITYETDFQYLKDIPALIKSIVEGHPKIEKDTYRVNLVKFDNYSINFEIAFYVMTGEYVEFLQVQEEILLAIKQKFNDEQIEFAYPTNLEYHKVIDSE